MNQSHPALLGLRLKAVQRPLLDFKNVRECPSVHTPEPY